MNLLALDTSTPRAAVALSRSDGRTFVAPIDPSRRQGSDLLPAIRDLLARAELRASNLEGIAVGLGPGSFTGLRVGLMAVKMLAYATGAAVVGLDGLEILVRNAPADAHRACVIVDAQRGDLHAADFDRDAATGLWVMRDPPMIEPAERVIAGWDESTFVLGPALAKVAERMPATTRHGDDSTNHPDPRRLIAMGREAFEQGRRDDPLALEPIYLRRSAAEDVWDARRR